MKQMKKWFFVMILLWAFIIWQTHKKQAMKKEDIAPLNEKIHKAIYQENFPLAIDLLENAFKKNPKLEKFPYLLANLYLQEQQLDKAHFYIDTALELFPDNPDFHLFKGRVFLAEGDTKKTRLWYWKTLQQNPTFLSVHLALIDLDIEELDLASVPEKITKLKESFPQELEQYPEFHWLEGKYAFLSEKFPLAVASLEKFLQIRPLVIEARIMWGKSLAAQGKLSLVHNYFNQILQKEKRLDRDFYLSAYSHFLDPNTALSILEQSSSNLLKEKSLSILFRQGKYELVEEKITKLKLTGYQSLSLDVLSLENYTWQKQFSSATDILKRITQKKFPQANALSKQVQLALAQENFSFAKKLLEKSNNSSLVVSKTKFFLEGEIYHQEGLWKKSLAKLLNQEKQMPEDFPSRYQLYQKIVEVALSSQESSLAQKYISLLSPQESSAINWYHFFFIWQGVLHLEKGDSLLAEQTWKKGLQFPWEKYIIKGIEKEILEWISEKSFSQQLEPFCGIPFLGNDVCYFLGLGHELKGNIPLAQKFYKKGLQKSLGREFPYYLLAQKLEK